MNRRDFLKLSALAPVAALLPKALADIDISNCSETGCNCSDDDIEAVGVGKLVFVRTACQRMHFIHFDNLVDDIPTWQEVDPLHFVDPLTGNLVADVNKWFDSHVARNKKEWDELMQKYYGYQLCAVDV